MNRILVLVIFLLSYCWHAEAGLKVGVGVSDITPPVGTPSAGYEMRYGQEMKGVHDPLLATAIFIDNEERQIAICSVDHLGFDYEMVQQIKEKICHVDGLSHCTVYVSSSHTHSGGGAFMDIPLLGEMLAGKFDPHIRQFYIDGTVQAIISAKNNITPAKIGFGNGNLKGMTYYRGSWPQGVNPPNNLNVIKITSLDDQPISVLFNFALHPTTLGKGNFLFSADFVGVARTALKKSLEENVVPIFINGAQAELIPSTDGKTSEWDLCQHVGDTLAASVLELWHHIATQDQLEIITKTLSYTFEVAPTTNGLQLPFKDYRSEINFILFDHQHGIVTIPGELSCVYDQRLAEYAQKIGYRNLAIFGLTNDAHGYIITPEAWEHRTKESRLSFGGRGYGENLFNAIRKLLL